MVHVENLMLKHINSLSSVLGGPVPIYADSPIMKQGRPTGELLRCPFFNPEAGVRLTHVSNLGNVHIGVHHRENSSRFTDFSLVFPPLELSALKHESRPDASYAGGPYTVRIEFKTSDEAVLSEVRVAGKGGTVDEQRIPDPEPAQSETKRKSLLGQLGGMLKSAVNSSARSADRTRKSVDNFKQLDDDDGADEPECYAHDCVQFLRTWLAQEVAWPMEEILKRDIDDHKGKGY